MPGFFSDKYRRGTHRLPGHDYSAPGKYFITICTKNMDHFLGRIEYDVMILSEAGHIVENYWLEIPSHYPNAILDEYVIMPDHIHGIIVIKSKSKVKATLRLDEDRIATISEATPKLGVGTGDRKYNIGIIINQFKRICTTMSKLKGIDLAWHPRYYDHVIRGHLDLCRIREYIRNNPGNYNK